MTTHGSMTIPGVRDRRGIRAFFFAILISSFVISAIAQDEQPPPKKTGVQLQFIPPPMEGTVSLGIYDAAGKLVRVLHAESPQTEFTAALNGLITFWDGKDDAGKMMPSGKYRARGYLVGAMEFEGVAFLGNDWIYDPYGMVDDLHVRRITKISVNQWGMLECDYLSVKETSGSLEGGVSEIFFKPVGITAAVKDGGLVIKKGGAEKIIPAAASETVLDATTGFGDIAWTIVKTATGIEVRAYSADGEFIRHLTFTASEPQPVSIKASPFDAAIHLLEENARMQRVRTLKLQTIPQTTEAGTVTISLWKITFSKTITFSDTLDQVRDLLKFPSGKPFVPQEKIALTLLPNPLEQDRPGAVDIGIAMDAKGSFLKAGDGLPLCRVSETPNLRWAAMAREPESKALTIFQSDGAVVEQFKASRLANMMAFDCGDFDFTPPKQP